jgi:hypothetical protein
MTCDRSTCACKLLKMIDGTMYHTGYCYATITRLNYSQEESLEDTANLIDHHYAFVAEELSRPLVMGFQL